MEDLLLLLFHLVLMTTVYVIYLDGFISTKISLECWPEGLAGKTTYVQHEKVGTIKSLRGVYQLATP